MGMQIIAPDQSNEQSVTGEGISVSATEIIDELISRVSQLTMEVAAKDVIIRKMQEQIAKTEDTK